MFGGMPTNFVCEFKKKIGGVVMPKYFIDLKKCLGWGMQPYAKTFKGFGKNVGEGGGGYAQIFYRLEKCWGGGGYANKFMDLKNVGGGGGLC